MFHENAPPVNNFPSPMCPIPYFPCGTIRALISHKPYIGKKTANNVNGSPVGVINPAVINNTTIACRRYFLKKPRVSKPIFPNNHANNGNSNTAPITNISVKKLSIYELSDIIGVIVALN